MTSGRAAGRGGAIVGLAAIAAIAAAALCMAVAGTGQQGIEYGLRATAVLGLPFLAGAYAAPGLTAIRPGRLSEWLLARRRALGLAFAAVFAVHLLLIARLLSLPPDPGPSPVALAFGFVAYLLLAGMAATSFERFEGRLGTERVRLLRRVGEQWVFAVFTLTLAVGAATRSVLWLAPLSLVLAAYGVRVAAARRRRGA